ncbi:hypothetical protein OFM39_35675, partial [Escherichia coli]|nr:hypothetical protein [Escherichia coli]
CVAQITRNKSGAKYHLPSASFFRDNKIFRYTIHIEKSYHFYLILIINQYKFITSVEINSI